MPASIFHSLPSRFSNPISLPCLPNYISILLALLWPHILQMPVLWDTSLVEIGTGNQVYNQKTAWRAGNQWPFKGWDYWGPHPCGRASLHGLKQSTRYLLSREFWRNRRCSCFCFGGSRFHFFFFFLQFIRFYLCFTFSHALVKLAPHFNFLFLICSFWTAWPKTSAEN